MKKILVALLIFSLTPMFAQQKRDVGMMKVRKSKFFEQIKEKIHEFNTVKKEPRKSFVLDFSGYNLPKSINEFKYYWHRKPHSQGMTGTCWSFSTTSFFESEVYRLHKKKVALSEMWTAYWEYVEKAKGFVRTRGKSLFAQGSEANAVTRIWEKYGIVPYKLFTGFLPGQQVYDHDKMFKEMYTFLQSVKKTDAWNEGFVVSTIKQILNKYMGTPPTKVTVDGKTYTPKEYLANYLQLNMNNYVDIISYMQQPYWKQVPYQVPDNWWHDSSYYNVPLDVFMKIIKKAITHGYTMAIGGDVSEPGIDGKVESAVIPSFDIPSAYIDQYARQFRFSNRTTTDDHGIHLIGYKKDKDGKYWFLIKDSGSRAFNGKNKGYFFYNEDYVKLKIMDFMVNKEIVKDVLKKFK